MQKIIRLSSNLFLTNTWLLLLGFLVAIPACKKPPEPGKNYQEVNLVANTDEYHAARIDANFINGWGIAFGPSGVAWVSANGSGVSEVWDKDGNQLIPAVTIPSPGNSTMGGQPTGQVFNGTSDFKLTNGNPARFIFAGLNGIISGWNGGSSAEIAVNDSKSGAVYPGIALAQDGGSNFLYVANFSAHKIDVYDKNWTEVNKPFKDPNIPGNYSPFNIQNVQGKLFVMYAKIGSDGNEVHGAGLGIVDIYNPDGSLDKRFASHGSLNSPWGVAAAPLGFWGDNDKDDLAGVILVGNFGDGRINAFDKWGHLLGQLKSKGKTLEIEGLWGISFPPSTATTVDPGRLYFAAGPDEETHGLFGYIINKTKGE